MLGRRSAIALTLLSAPAIVGRAHSQNAIPDKPIRLLVGFANGNGTDTVARELAPQLERRAGRRINVENRVGTSGAVAGEALKTGPNDGSMLALLPSTTVSARLGAKDYPFDPLLDTAPITILGRFGLALAVSPTINVRTYEEYLDYLKKGGGDRAVLGSTAPSDAFSAVYGKMMGRALGVPVKVSGFRGGTAMVNDLEKGLIPAAISNLPTLLTAHRGGRIRIILLSGSKRSQAAPNLPTAAELKVEGFDLREWYMLFTGGRAPEAAIDAWYNRVNSLLGDAAFKGVITQLGLDVETTTPEQSRALVLENLNEWRQRMEGFGVLPAN